VQENRLTELIEKLISEGEKAANAESFPLIDDARHLSAEKRLAWAQLLSSAASAEESEEMVIEPILKAFDFAPRLHRYLTLHAADESRHQVLLKEYVKNTFQYVKRKKSITDRVIYDGVFRGIKGLTEKRPLAIIVATLFYEWFAEEFYSDLVAAAQRDNLPGLKYLFEQIEKDEKRHRAGLKAVLALWKLQGKSVDTVDLAYTKTLLNIVRLDVNTAPWAFYNKKLRRNLTIIGMSPDKIYSRSKDYADKAFNELKALQGNH
jgi:rubrerythrin